jgi:hypothetical protein
MTYIILGIFLIFSADQIAQDTGSTNVTITGTVCEGYQVCDDFRGMKCKWVCEKKDDISGSKNHRNKKGKEHK